MTDFETFFKSLSVENQESIKARFTGFHYKQMKLKADISLMRQKDKKCDYVTRQEQIQAQKELREKENELSRINKILDNPIEYIKQWLGL